MTNSPSYNLLQPDSDQEAKAKLVREGNLVRLRQHTSRNLERFQNWYADPEIANLLRHDLRPLNERQSRGYFEAIMMPNSDEGRAFAIHTSSTDELIGSAALTPVEGDTTGTPYLRILIGEKSYWNRGYGTEATRLVLAEGFEQIGADEIRLEVFMHNPRAKAVYDRLGFVKTGDHTEWVGPEKPLLHVIEMRLAKDQYDATRSNRAVDQATLSHV